MAVSLQSWTVTEPFVHLGCLLGEGPYFEPTPDGGRLRFVDIERKQLHTVSPALQLSSPLSSPSYASPSVSTLQLDVPISVTADVEGADPRSTILVALKFGVALLDRVSGHYQYLARWCHPQDESSAACRRLRSNDGAVDPNGRFWVGTMTDFDLGPFQAEGALLLVQTEERRVQLVFPDLTIPNSVGWSPDRRTMYFTHSTSGEILAWDYDQAVPPVTRVFYRYTGPGFPDGFCVDATGCLWQAVWGASCVLRIDPLGRVIGEVRVPTSNVTCTVLAPNGYLFITTAAEDDPHASDESRRLGGALFRLWLGPDAPEPLAPFKFRMPTTPAP